MLLAANEYKRQRSNHRNVFIERLWRSVKYEYVYSGSAREVTLSFDGLTWTNPVLLILQSSTSDQGIGRITSAEMYKPVGHYRGVA